MADAPEKMTFGDLETPICDADRMVDVLMELLESQFGAVPKGNFVVTESDGNRIMFVAYQVVSMSRKAKKAYLEAIEGNVS